MAHPEGLSRSAWLSHKPELTASKEEVMRDVVEVPMHCDLRILRVEENSAAAAAGIKSGDIIERIDGEMLADETSLAGAIQDGKEHCLLVVDDEGQSREVMITALWSPVSRCFRVGLDMEVRPSWNLFEMKEKRVRLAFDYRAYEGAKVAKGYVVMGPEEPCKDWAGECESTQRRVEQYVLQVSQKEVGTREVDLIKWFDPAGRTNVYWSPWISSRGAYSNRDDEVVLRDLTSPLTPHVIAHEFRHAFQNHEGRFRDIGEYYVPVGEDVYDKGEMMVRVFFHQQKDATNALRDILTSVFGKKSADALWESRGPVMNETFLRMRNVKERIKAFYKRFGYVRLDVMAQEEKIIEESYQNRIMPFFEEIGRKDLLGDVRTRWEEAIRGKPVDWNEVRDHLEGEADFEKANKHKLLFDLLIDTTRASVMSDLANLKREERQRTEALEQERKQVKKAEEDIALELADLQIGEIRLADVLRLPTWIIERDAECGALKALRALKRETGIDLLRNFSQGLDGKEEDETPLSRVRAKVQSLREANEYMRKIGVPTHCVREARRKHGKHKKTGLEEANLLSNQIDL